MRPLRGAFERLTSFQALWEASRRARRGKRRSPSTARFEHHVEPELLRLQAELRSGAFRFGGYRSFTVQHPQQREIRAAPYRDRVVHHAVCGELEPLVERHLIYDTYACRVGKGTHRALDRLQHFLRGGSWVVKVDVRKYFFTIDHEILLRQMRRLYRDPRLDDLLVSLVGGYDAGPEYAFGPNLAFEADRCRPRGLPIGNLTSQLFANHYLNPVDRFVKESLGVRRYVRYMDDLVLVAPDRATARDWLEEVGGALEELRLTPHPRKSQIHPVRNGVRFLGFRVYPHHRRILRENLQRFSRRMRRYAARVGEGQPLVDRVERSLNAWLGFAGRHPNRVFLNAVLEPIRFQPPRARLPYAFWLPPEPG